MSGTAITRFIPPPQTKVMKTKLCTSIGILLTASVQFSQAVAVEYDLTTAGSSATINNGLFQTTFFTGAGTGNFNPFLDLVHSDKPAGTEGAYNSSAWPLDGDNHRDVWNSDLKTADLQEVDVGGTKYYLFTLDANETGGGNDNKLLSIDQIKIYQSADSGLNPGIANLDDLGDLVWDMDAGAEGDTWVKINSALESAGSGDGDLNLFIPVNLFNKDLEFIYFFNHNGGQEGPLFGHAGFEEWRALTKEDVPVNEVPDGGGTLVSLGVALLGLGSMRKLLGSKA